MKRDLFLFVPAYNVEKELPDLLRSIPAEILLRTEEILVVDDGSSDGTRKVAADFLQNEIRTRVRIESFASNRGYGAVVKCGISRAKFLKKDDIRFAVCLHGDGQYPASAIPRMISVLEDSRTAAVQGSRLARKGSARKGKMPIYKFIGGKILTKIENIVFTNKLTDRHSGLIAFRVDFLETLELSKLSASFDIDLEILAIADAKGFQISEVPIETRYADEKSNLSVIPYGLRVLRIILLRFLGRYG